MSQTKHPEQKQELVKVDPAVAALAVFAEEDAGMGFENKRSSDFAIPFIAILQKGSPEVDKDNLSKYVPGAEVGKFFDSSTKELYDSLDVIVCHYKNSIIEWKPRESGGGFVASHPLGYQLKFKKNEKGRWIIPESGNELLDTRYFFCLLVKKDGSLKPVILSLTSTQIKTSKEWYTRMDSIQLERGDGTKFTPAMFAFSWHLSTVVRTKDEFTWRGLVVGDNTPVTAEVYKIAKENRNMFVENENALQPAGTPGDNIEFPGGD